MEGGGGRFLIDCGASSLIALKRLGLEPNADATSATCMATTSAALPFFVLEAQFLAPHRPPTVAGPLRYSRRG
ncbi:MAG: hypothetical protein U0531_20605 [Dehalococcoidia bacterium]